jgi:hypothetical protein
MITSDGVRECSRSPTIAKSEQTQIEAPLQEAALIGQKYACVLKTKQKAGVVARTQCEYTEHFCCSVFQRDEKHDCNTYSKHVEGEMQVRCNSFRMSSEFNDNQKIVNRWSPAIDVRWYKLILKIMSINY